MSSLPYTDQELLEMERNPNPAVNREPYHLTYARAHRGNEILNPHLPGNRHMAAGRISQEGAKNEVETV